MSQAHQKGSTVIQSLPTTESESFSGNTADLMFDYIQLILDFILIRIGMLYAITGACEMAMAEMNELHLLVACD